MSTLEFRREEREPTRIVRAPLVVDYDEEGSTIGIEILGYSHISGKTIQDSDFRWLEDKSMSLGCDAESDVLSIQVTDGSNCGQKTLDAAFEFDADDDLLALTIE